MPGSSSSLAFPTAVINLAVSDGLEEVLRRIGPVSDESEIINHLRDLIKQHSGVIFEGDNYDQKWKEEARKRGLFIPCSVPDTIDRMEDEKNIALFQKYNILQRDEIKARADIKIELYVKTVEIELRVARYMLRAYIIPAAMKNQELLLNSIRNYPPQILEKNPTLLDCQLNFLERFTQKISKAMEWATVLDEDSQKLKLGTDRERADYCSTSVRPHLAETADLVEKIEDRVDHGFWEMPRVADILFR